jgi:hypothetical protein
MNPFSSQSSALDPLDRQAAAHRRRLVAGGSALALGALGLGLVGATVPAQAAGAHGIHVLGKSPYKVKTLATGLGGNLKPDDSAVLGSNVFVAYQNGVGATGTAATGTGVTFSTIVEYKKKKVVGSWQVTGKCDGLAANAVTGEIIASVNEDGNSSIYTVNPATNAIVHFAYNVDPASLGGGGTDSISVIGSQVFVAGSNPSLTTAPATYSVALNGTTKVATLTPVFADNATAAGPSGTVTLGLTDPDTTAVVPSQSPLYAGDLAVVGQADQQVIFVHNPGASGQTLTQLPIGTNIDGLAWATSSTGSLVMTDNSTNTVYRITGTFAPGTVFVDTASDSGMPGVVGTLNLTTGQITPIITGFTNPHGLSFVP